MSIRDLFGNLAGRAIGSITDEDMLRQLRDHQLDALQKQANPPVSIEIDPAITQKKWEDALRRLQSYGSPPQSKDRVQRLTEAVAELTKIVVDLNKR